MMKMKCLFNTLGVLFMGVIAIKPRDNYKSTIIYTLDLDDLDAWKVRDYAPYSFKIS